MENGVDGAHAARQMEGERVSTCLSNKFKRSKVLLHKFLRWSSGSDVVGLGKHLVPNDQVQGQDSAFVGGRQVSSLCHGDSLLELEMEFIEVDNKISCLE